MGLFKNLDLAISSTIDWEMTPEYAFGTFESWGGKERVRSIRERIYYFFIDNWGDTPKLCLMERGIKHARVAAEITAPKKLLADCVAKQGKTARYEKSYAIDDALKTWLIANVVEVDDGSKIIPLPDEAHEDLPVTGLPGANEIVSKIDVIILSNSKEELSEENVSQLIHTYNFYDCERNTNGRFKNHLVDNNDNLTVSDKVTKLMWQRQGLDIMSYKMLNRETKKLNTQNLAGFSDWRIPTLVEAMSLMQPELNNKNQHIHACFSSRQPFIFADAIRKPGGYWFVDYNHGRAFWASGTNPGGFGRLCRTETT